MMRCGPLTILLAGVGGQGVISAGDVLAEAAFISGFDVKKSEVHGLSRRFGSVACQVRLGTPSPRCGHGAVDILVAFEVREGLRQLPYLRDTGTALLNRLWIGSNPEQSTSEPRIYWFEGSMRVRALGQSAGLNLYMLGVLAGLLPLVDEAWREAIHGLWTPAAQSANWGLFAAGRRDGEKSNATRSNMEIST